MSTVLVGHLTAFFTVFIWGLTFVSTKVLLENFTPIEILFYRFTIGLIALNVIYPARLKLKDKKHEIYFIFAGITGITLYFLFENIALTYTYASNVGMLVTVTPLFTGIVAYIFLKEKLNAAFFVGLFIASAGIAMIIFNGSVVLKINPKGDILAVLACFVWSFYSVLVKKICSFNYNSIQITRRIFFYGLVFMLPALFFMGFRLDINRFLSPVNTGNMLFLGLGASAVCFASWSYAVKLLGAIKSSVYIYMVPVITIIASSVILKEKLTSLAICGGILALTGLIISDGKLTGLVIKKLLSQRV